MRQFPRNLLWSGVVAALTAGTIEAQCTPGGPASPRWEPRSIAGIVMDTSHEVLSNVNVAIRDPRRQAKTDADGRFRLSDLDPGTYEITVRRIGYEIAVQKYTVTDSGGVARFCLVPEPTRLAPMIASVPRGGLTGIIGDSMYNSLAGAEVRPLAGGSRVITDSAGSFYLPLKPGRYAITVKKEGYEQKLLSVTIPNDSGRRIAVWLFSPQKNARRVAAAIEDSMRFRLLMARPNRAKLLTSEDLALTPADVQMAVQAAAIERVDSSCEAVIDGGPFTLPLYMIDKDEIAAMEVYAIPSARGGATSLNAQGTAPMRAKAPATCKVSVYVWLK